MDVNIYKNYERQTKNILTVTGEDIFFSDEDFIGGMTYTEAVNNGEDLMIGSSCASSIEFELNNLNLMLENLTNKELIWQTGIEVGSQSFEKLVKRTKSDLICLHEQLAFVKKKNLTLWRLEPLEQIEFRDVPVLPIESLFVIGNILYCGHNEAPYVTAYQITQDTLVRVETPTLSAVKRDKLFYYNKHHIAFNWQGLNLKEYTVKLYDLNPVTLLETTYELLQVGIFKAEKPVKVNDTRIKVIAYDRMTLFDKKIDEWFQTVQYPIKLKNLLTNLCKYVGVTCKTTQFLNGDMEIKKNFVGTDVTGRQLLQWVVEIAAQFARITPSGELELAWYKPVQYVIDSSCYSEVEISDYEVKRIDKLQIRVEENDIGVIVGSGVNAYVIQNNPLLYADKDSELRGVATNIFNAIKEFKYYPYKLTGLPNPLIRAGDIVTINTTAGQTIQAVIMNRKLTSLRDEYSATGSENRTPNQSLHTSIIALRGATNVLHRSIEETKSIITDVEKGLQSQITQNAKEISLRVTQTEFDANKQSTDNRIAKAESEIVQNAQEISLKVSQTDYNGNTISSLINQTATTIQIQAEKVNLVGYTTFTDLSTSGKTTIHGGNIMTDTIGAKQINTSELVVGDNIRMGPNAMISWDNVTGTGNVAELGDIPSDAYITRITKDMIRTDSIYARYLEVEAANIRGEIIADKVDASNITGDEIYGLTLRTNGGVAIDEDRITFGNGSGEIYYGRGTLKFESDGDCSFGASGDIYLLPWRSVRVDGDLRISGSLYINNTEVRPQALLKLIEKLNEEDV